MNKSEYDVVGIGNAIVDLITQIDDAFLQENGLSKGSMTIIDAATAEKIYCSLSTKTEISGGSAANTLAGVAALGGNTMFIGKVGDDDLGKTFALDISNIGVTYQNKPKSNGAPTATSFIFVTPDAERTMQTFLGACVELAPEDIDPDLITKSKIIYLEGYLWDPPNAKLALIKAAKVAADAGRKTSLSLSDSFCVKRHRQEFLAFIDQYIDILFANEEEIKSLYLTNSFDEAIQKVRQHCQIAVVTRGSIGSVILSGETACVLEATPVKKVIDTTGAGDAYAAGFLYGYTQGKDLSTCGQIAGVTAAEIISHYGARPETNLVSLIKETLRW